MATDRDWPLATDVADGWRMFWLRTQHAEYLLGWHQSPEGSFVVLQTELTPDNTVRLRDDAPSLDGGDLFAATLADWKGKRLKVDALETAALLEVREERDAEVIASFVHGLDRGRSARRAAAGERSPTFPEAHVEMLEEAARLMTAVYREKGLVEALAKNPDLKDRFSDALAECALMTRALSNKAS
jgi:hypothetical protein